MLKLKSKDTTIKGAFIGFAMSNKIFDLTGCARCV
jgi:hypothetical protein